MSFPPGTRVTNGGHEGGNHVVGESPSDRGRPTEGVVRIDEMESFFT